VDGHWQALAAIRFEPVAGGLRPSERPNSDWVCVSAALLGAKAQAAAQTLEGKRFFQQPQV
jgi:hypothetical protein